MSHPVDENDENQNRAARENQHIIKNAAQPRVLRAHAHALALALALAAARPSDDIAKKNTTLLLQNDAGMLATATAPTPELATATAPTPELATAPTPELATATDGDYSDYESWSAERLLAAPPPKRTCKLDDEEQSRLTELEARCNKLVAFA
jgi:hypothetical protein